MLQVPLEIAFHNIDSSPWAENQGTPEAESADVSPHERSEMRDYAMTAKTRMSLRSSGLQIISAAELLVFDAMGNG
jgi:hypothetical protein